MKKILLTGFEPFGDWKVNPTAVAASSLDGKVYNNVQVIGKVISLRYHDIESELSSLIGKYQPAVAILTGQAGGAHIQLERYAHNEAKTSTPYNCGSTPDGEQLVDDGAYQLVTTLPLAKYHSALLQHNIPVQFSDSAGRFGCNQIFYLARYYFPDIPAGFIHVPLLPDQVSSGQASMTQEMITAAIDVICEITSQAIEPE